MGDRMIALLRTAVPVLYGHVAAFLVFLGAPEQLVTDYRAYSARASPLSCRSRGGDCGRGWDRICPTGSSRSCSDIPAS